MKQLFLEILSFILFTLSSCTFFSGQAQTEKLIVQLPQWPPCDAYKKCYPELSRWLIKTSCGDSFFTLDASLTFYIPKNMPFAVTAQPLTKVTIQPEEECSFFKPAGLVYPSRKQYITWEDGFLADIMLRLTYSKKESGITDEHIQDFLSSFNWKKAQDYINNKLTKALENTDLDNQKFYNPWLCDCTSLLTCLSFGEFNTNLLANSDSFFLNTESLPSPALSSFVLENAFIAVKQSLLIHKDCPTLFYTKEDCGIIVEGSSPKNLSVRHTFMPIFLKDNTIYEDNS